MVLRVGGEDGTGLQLVARPVTHLARLVLPVLVLDVRLAAGAQERAPVTAKKTGSTAHS